MVKYDKMYYLLCSAIDKVLFQLEGDEKAKESYDLLREALLTAEDLYITDGESMK